MIPRHSGQAMIEAMIALLVLLSLWVGVSWLLRWQDMQLQATHASRFAAFSITRHPDLRPIEDIRRFYFAGAHQWRNRDGGELLRTDRSEVSLHASVSGILPPEAQPGGRHVDAMTARTDWRIEDAGIMTATISVARHASSRSAAENRSALAGFNLGLVQFDAVVPRPHARISILTGAASASSDGDAQSRTAGSVVAWRSAAERSFILGSEVKARAFKSDSGWNRNEPSLDWFAGWTSMVPSRHLKSHGEFYGQP